MSHSSASPAEGVINPTVVAALILLVVWYLCCSYIKDVFENGQKTNRYTWIHAVKLFFVSPPLRSVCTVCPVLIVR